MVDKKVLKSAILLRFNTLAECADSLGVDNSTLSRLMNIQSNKFLKRLNDIGVQLPGMEEEEREYISNGEAETIKVPQLPQYPICGTIPAGVAEINDLTDWPEMEDAFFSPSDHFYLKIDDEYGDSMRPIIKPGDLILCSLSQIVKENDLCAVRYDGTKGAIKIYEEHGDTVVLRSVNPAYDPIKVKKENIVNKYKVVMIKKNS